jgi:DNA-damage-inducible protein D
MYLDPEQQDDVTIVRALMGWLRDRSAVGAELLLDQGTVYLDGARDRVVYGLPGPATVYVQDTPDLRDALAGAVRAVLGPRFAAYIRDLDANEPAEAIPFEERDGWQDVHEEVLAMAQEPRHPAGPPPEEQQQRSHRSPFERIRRIAEDGSEYWSSRDLAQVLGYDTYHDVADHFMNTTEPVALGKGATRNVDVVYLSRYACYLAIQNADPRKPMVALGQTYFTVQTRRQELADVELEDSLRVKLREEIKVHNKHLAAAAYSVGVRTPSDYAIFQDHGYKGLYAGLGVGQIKEMRGLKRNQDALDFMGSTELAANLFRATQTEEKMRRDAVEQKEEACRIHHLVGAKVRETMRELGGAMPEELPVAEHIRTVRRRLQAPKRREALKAL